MLLVPVLQQLIQLVPAQVLPDRHSAGAARQSVFHASPYPLLRKEITWRHLDFFFFAFTGFPALADAP